MRPIRKILLLVLALMVPKLAFAEMREFEDSFGRIIKAALVSHTGADSDTVKIKKADGKEFDVKVSQFSAKGQASIREWMKQTPPTINYAFRIEAGKRKIGTGAATCYDVKVTNLGREKVDGIKVKTRSIYEHYYVPSSPNYYSYGGRLVALEESFDIPAELKFNQTAKFSTTDRYNLIGILVQVSNAEGKVVGEEKIGSTKLGRLTWDDGRKREPSSTRTTTGVPGSGGGKTTVEIED